MSSDRKQAMEGWDEVGEGTGEPLRGSGSILYHDCGAYTDTVFRF